MVLLIDCLSYHLRQCHAYTIFVYFPVTIAAHEESTYPLFRSVFSLFHRSNDVHGCCMVFRRSSRTQRILLLSCLTFSSTLLLSNYLARSVILISWCAYTSRKLRIASGQSLRFSERESLTHSSPFQTSNHSSIPAESG